MKDLLISYGIASYVTQGILIIPFQADFYDEVINALETEVASKLHGNSEICGLILDLSQVQLLDLSNMQSIESLLNMAQLLGAPGVIAGLQPLVTLTLVDLGYDPKNIAATTTVSQAIERIQKQLVTTDSSVYQTDEELNPDLFNVEATSDKASNG